MPIPTPHIEVEELNVIAETVFMPGDPLRAKLIADTYLTNVIQFNQIRNMFGYTGYYKGKKISVMGSGMGMPSIGIYSYELFAFYGVNNIIRLGSAGSYDPDIKIYDVVLVKDAWSESTYAKVQSGYPLDIIESSAELNHKIKTTAIQQHTPLQELRIHSTDVFYYKRVDDFKNIRDQHGCKCAEMEAFALFANAKLLNKQAACLLTISDSLVTHESTTSLERQNSLTTMIKLALESICI